MTPQGGRRAGRVRVAAAAVVAALIAAVTPAGCTPADPAPTERQPMEVRSDPDLDKKIDDLRATGGSAPLRDLTGFSWDTVYCYYEGTPADKVNEAVGATVLRPGSYLQVSGALAVFVESGKVVKPLVIRELTFDRSVFPAAVVVERGVRLADPASPSAGTPGG